MTGPSHSPSSTASATRSAPCRATSTSGVYAARDDEEAIVVIHEWADESSFAGYLSSDAFARSDKVIRPLVTEPPVSRRFRATLVETV